MTWPIYRGLQGILHEGAAYAAGCSCGQGKNLLLLLMPIAIPPLTLNAFCINITSYLFLQSSAVSDNAFYKTEGTELKIKNIHMQAKNIE